METADKVALVTGGGSGIGRATALALGRAGTAVVVADFDDQAGKEAAAAIEAAGGKAAFIHTDVSREEDLREAVRTAEASFGGLDILHNNAGRLTGVRFPDTGPDRWRRTIEVNLFGVLWGIYAAVPAMQRRGEGAIVNTASSAGLGPHHLDPIYAATKAAVVNLTRSLVFLHDEANIRVNCVCPGLVETNLSRHTSAELSPEERDEFHKSRERLVSGRHLQPDAIAEAVLKLIRDDSLYGRAYSIAAGREDEIL